MSNSLFAQSAKPWKPHKYQKKALKFLLEHACSALFLDPGLGKTSITCAAIKFLQSKKIAKKALVIAPLRPCYDVWPKEIQKWTDFKKLRIEILHGPDKDAALKRKADIYVINPEGLEWLLQATKTKSPITGKTKMQINLKKFKAHGFDILVVDELSKFKHPSTNRFKMLKKVLPTFSRRWGLTGLPTPNGLMDLFGQCYILDLGNALGAFITHYRNSYFNPTGYMGKEWVLREGAEKEIYERLEPLAIRMAAEDYIDMPKLITDNIFVELPKKVYKVYDDLEEHLIAQIGDKEVVAANAGVASAKCRQVVNGGLYLDPEVEALIKVPKGARDWIDLHTEKLDAVEELMGELQGAPLLVAYEFKHDLARLLKKFGKNTPYVGGGVTPKKCDEIFTKWNAGQIPLLLGHPQAMSHGLNLQEGGHHVCFHSMFWDYDLYYQFIRRLLRQGSKASRVFVYHILARGTIDEVIYSALQSKGRSQQELFKAIQKLRAQRLGSLD